MPPESTTCPDGPCATCSAPIADFPGYRISAFGYAYSPHGRRLTPDPRGGYLRVQMRRSDGALRWRPLHLLVLEAFVGPRPSPRHHGAHRDGRARNNQYDNLEWKLPPENEADKKAHGTARGGGRRPASHPARVSAIRRRAARGESYSTIATRYGMHRHSVSRIARGLRH